MVVVNMEEDIPMTGLADASSSSAVAISQPGLPTDIITHITNQINFAPTAPAKNQVLRSWERQPSTAFLARHKSRKIWKRFRRSMEALRGRIGSAAAPSQSQIEESELVSEISQSANAAYIRAVKRQRLRRREPAGIRDQDAQMERGWSFVDTKWELETGKRRRKLVALTQDFMQEEQQSVATGQDIENEAECDSVKQLLEEVPNSVTPNTSANIVENGASEEDDDDDDADRSAVISEIADLAKDAQGGEAAAEVREFIAKQEADLVRSALRMNSLDGDDAALLSEFLSRAQAKRAVNAAMASSDDTDVSQKSVRKGENKRAEEEEKKKEKEKKPTTEKLNSPAKQSRRVLEELDVNSPSALKPSILTPVKAEKMPESPETSEPVEDANDQISSPTVACRRSARVKPTKTGQVRTLRPTVPNQIPVRRANGTEFVFLQRTEAQELALTTRKNTRRNKGNAVLPKYMLQAMNKQDNGDKVTISSTPNEEKHEDQDQPYGPQLRRSPRKHAGSKQVWWEDNKLVEYAPEKTSRASESPSPVKKKGGSSREKRQETTHALPATPSKKVRKINMVAPVSMNNASNGAAEVVNKPIVAGTPVPRRKKLTPRAPKETTTGISVVEFPSLYKSKASSTSAAASDARPAAKKQRSTASTSRPAAQKASGIPRSKSLIKGPGSTSTSSAGATPMVKRVRAKKL